MVIKECILKAVEKLRASGVENPTLDARVLLCKALNKNDVFVMVNPDFDVDCERGKIFFEYVERRSKHEPVAYITNEKEFMSMDFYVDKNVLIPRPDTEHLAELTIELVKKNGFKKAADFCTGSGALAITIGKCCDVNITGYDISEAALRVAERNKNRLGADNVNFKLMDVLTQLGDIEEKYEIVVSNPPYISGEEMKTLDKTVDEYEPHLALFGGEDGLDFYRVISENAYMYLSDGGILAFEVGHTQSEGVAEIMSKNFCNINIKKDYAGVDRVVYGKIKKGL